ncbi:aspartyl/asparaginyl beta-hydroxylase domain-containing protein [Bowmanella denitrificans]|uniref:aspartyl/asparaginyl beta-hydroxylase domain-containing protein n=1 Tax=Bowmanella denitrificans TaxID=366582 RepID=UPI000C9CF3E7|nr:aspartyl/asparaginyl beta-hydroxylase domain-containing protein [Bowmanella denitrificans]
MLFACLDFQVPLEALKKDVFRLHNAEWLPHVNQKDYQGSWDVLPLRCLAEHKSAHPIMQGFAVQTGDDWVNLPVLEQLSAILQVLSSLQCSIKSTRLMRLHAGAQIKPHRDLGLSIEYGEARLHIPILSNELLEFRVNNQLVPMREGELWYLNVDQTHQVLNRGDHERINLVIDCVANDWLKKKIQESSLCVRDNNDNQCLSVI